MKLYNDPSPFQIIIDHFSKSKSIELLPKWLLRFQCEDDPIFNPKRSNSFSYRHDLFSFDNDDDDNEKYYTTTTTTSTIHDESCKPYRNSLLHQEYIWQPIGFDLNEDHCFSNNRSSSSKTKKNNNNNNDDSSSSISYSIYIHLCNRLDQLERLMTMLGDLPMNVIQSLKMIQDQYQLLSIHIETRGEYADHQLFSVGDDHSPLAIFRPRAELSFTMKDLPDLFIQILCCRQMWGESVDHLFTNPLIELLINSIDKAGPAPCKGRSLTTILAEILEEHKKNNTLLIQCFNRFIIASLLGIYPHTNIPANFAVRHIIYRYFYLQMGSGEWIEKWISSYKYLVIYVMREYLFYIIEQMPGLNEYFQKNYFWYQIVQNTYHVMDHVRSELNKNLTNYSQLYPILDLQGDFIGINFKNESGYFQLIDNTKIHDNNNNSNSNNNNNNNNIHWHPSDGLFENIESLLDGFNKTNLSYCYRALSKPFVRLVTHRISALENKNFDLDEYKKQRKTRWNNSDNISTESMIPLSFEKWIEYMVIKCYDLDNLPTYDALCLYFKVTLSSVMRLQHAQELYELETDRSEIDEVLNDIFQENRRDIRILQIFFQSLQKRMSIVAYPLPEDIMIRQLESEIAHYGVDEVDHLPLGFGTYPICTNCNEFKFTIYEPQLNSKYVMKDIRHLTFKTPPLELIHTDYTTKVSLDLGSGKAFCSRYSFKPDKKNINGGGGSALGNVSNNDLIADFVSSLADLESKRKKKSKNVHKEDKYSKCPCEELSRINMIGIMLYTDSNGCIMRCVGCPTIIKVSREWSRIGGVGEPFACNRCQMILLQTKNETEKKYKQQEKEEEEESLSTTPQQQQILLEEEEEEEDNHKKKILEEKKKKKLEKFYNFALPSTQPCCLCQKKTRPKRSKKAFLLDDSTEAITNNQIRIRFMAFCEYHEHFHNYVTLKRSCQDTLMRLSELQIMYKYELEEIERKNILYGNKEGAGTAEDYQLRRLTKYGPLGTKQKKFKKSMRRQ